MNEFEYTIKDENGIHARPAGLIVKEAQKYDFDISIEYNGKVGNLKKLLALMGMGIKKGDTIKVFAEKGRDISPLLRFLEKTI